MNAMSRGSDHIASSPGRFHKGRAPRPRACSFSLRRLAPAPAPPTEELKTSPLAAVNLSVWNAGRVIPVELLGAIFEPWVRVPREQASGTERPSTSLGLGLFIVREIVSAHGGTIGVTSSAHAGTQFTIRLPKTESRPASGPSSRAGGDVLDFRETGRFG